MKIDLSYITRGYNIVASISSFLIESIKLNDNLKFLWEYDRYPLKSKIYHSHYSYIKRYLFFHKSVDSFFNFSSIYIVIIFCFSFIINMRINDYKISFIFFCIYFFTNFMFNI